MRPWSLAWRIRALVTLVVAVLVTIVAATAYRRFHSAYLGHLDRMLEIMTKGIAASLDRPAGGPDLLADVRTITESPWRGPQTHFRLWLDGNEEDLAASASRTDGKASFLWELERVRTPQVGQMEFFDIADKKKRHRAIWLRQETARGTGNALIVHPSGFEHRRLRELLLVLVATGGVAVVLGATLGTHLVLLGLQPLKKTTRIIARIQEPDSAAELSRLSVPGELRPVVDEIAGLVQRLGAALERERRFVADASHQLRTPISLARSTLELARTGDEAGRRKAVEEALEDLSRMQWLVDELLTLARMGQGTPVRSAVDLRLDTVLEELALSYERRAAEHGVKIVCEALPPSIVRGDEAMIRQLFAGLLDNALQYGPRGGTVRIRLEHGPGAHCTAQIEDQGGGIPPEAAEHLFDRFHRPASSQRLNPTGAGLGLCIARETARAHGGDVWMTSTPGVRTTFHVRLGAASVQT